MGGVSNEGKQIAFVLKGYPRLSETFIAQEIHSLLELGVDIAIYSLRHPTDTSTHPIHNEITTSTNYLPEYLYQEPIRVVRGLFSAFGRPGLLEAASIWIKDLKRDFTLNRIRRFGQALVLAYELPDSTRALHAHFLHTPASVTRYAAKIRGLPWSCSAHAKDIWTSPEWELREKLNDCEWLTTCTASNTEFLSHLATEDKVFLNYHGVDLKRFPQAPDRVSRNYDGSDPEKPVTLLSVGRAVSKKGYMELLNAFEQIPKNLHWKFIHIGGGELLPALKAQAQTMSIASRCVWLGAQSQQLVLSHYRQADLFVLNSKIDDNGDRDGLPNVIVEAQSQSLTVVSTNISGIPEIIENEENGLLVNQKDTKALTIALTRLISDPLLRQKMGARGNEKVREQLDKDITIQQLYKQFHKV